MDFVTEPADWLLGNSVSKEITSRAYPMQLFRKKQVRDWIAVLRGLISMLGFAFVCTGNVPWQVIRNQVEAQAHRNQLELTSMKGTAKPLGNELCVHTS